MLKSKPIIFSLIISLSLFFSPTFTHALEGIPPTLKIAEKSLSLNGEGIRTKFFQSVYFAGLYLSHKNNDAKIIIDANSPMAIRMKLATKHATLDKVSKGFLKGFKNSTNGNIAPVQQQINQFMKVSFNANVKKGDTFDFIYNPEKGTCVFKNNKQLGIIKGLPFKKSLFGIWLSNKPTQDSLKQSLLGN